MKISKQRDLISLLVDLLYLKIILLFKYLFLMDYYIRIEINKKIHIIE